MIWLAIIAACLGLLGFLIVTFGLQHQISALDAHQKRLQQILSETVRDLDIVRQGIITFKNTRYPDRACSVCKADMSGVQPDLCEIVAGRFAPGVKCPKCGTVEIVKCAREDHDGRRA